MIIIEQAAWGEDDSRYPRIPLVISINRNILHRVCDSVAFQRLSNPSSMHDDVDDIGSAEDTEVIMATLHSAKPNQRNSRPASRQSPPLCTTKRVYDRSEESIPQATIAIHDSKRPRVASSSNTQHLLRKSTRGPDKYKRSSYMGPWVSETQHTLTSHHPTGPHQLARPHSAHAHPHATSHTIRGSTPQPQPGPSRPSRPPSNNSSWNVGSRYRPSPHVALDDPIDESMEDYMLDYTDSRSHQMEDVDYTSYDNWDE